MSWRGKAAVVEWEGQGAGGGWQAGPPSQTSIGPGAEARIVVQVRYDGEAWPGGPLTPVWLALVPSRQPDSSASWRAGEWDPVHPDRAGVLVLPGQLLAGVYRVLIRFEAGAEMPVLRAGYVTQG